MIDLSKNVEDVLKEAKTAELQDVKTALETEKAKAADEQRSTLITGLEKIVADAEKAAAPSTTAPPEQSSDGDTAQPSTTPTPPEEVQPVAKENEKLKGLKSVTVHVNTEKLATGAAFYDPDQKVTIRAEPVSVKRTKFIQQKLANEELVEA